MEHRVVRFDIAVAEQRRTITRALKNSSHIDATIAEEAFILCSANVVASGLKQCWQSTATCL